MQLVIFFYLHLMLHACVQRFDVMGGRRNILGLHGKWTHPHRKTFFFGNVHWKTLNSSNTFRWWTVEWNLPLTTANVTLTREDWLTSKFTDNLIMGYLTFLGVSSNGLGPSSPACSVLAIWAWAEFFCSKIQYNLKLTGDPTSSLAQIQNRILSLSAAVQQRTPGFFWV
jgi:hypothetical protein